MENKLAIDILRQCNFEAVQLPYNKEQEELTQQLKDEGMIKCVFEDDQPTHILTIKGKHFLKQLKG